jgi:hypothetical protein
MENPKISKKFRGVILPAKEPQVSVAGSNGRQGSKKRASKGKFPQQQHTTDPLLWLLQLLWLCQREPIHLVFFKA